MMSTARLKRLSAALLRTVSLLVLLCSLGLWVRSCETPDLVTRSTEDGRYCELVTIPGQVRVTWARGWFGESPWRWRHGKDQLPLVIFGQQNLSRKWYLFGTGLRGFTRTVIDIKGGIGVLKLTVSYRILAIPLSLPAFLAALPFAWTILRTGRRRRVREARIAARLCTECGYDLRASEHRCPECGTAIAMPIKA
jgi:hypothetical protein